MDDNDLDIPYGEDFHDVATARAWADAAIRKRPWRATIFEQFVAIIASAPIGNLRILELGSGPGFLAEKILASCPPVQSYTLLDFAEPMLEQSRQRLVSHAARTRFLQADFKAETWPELLTSPFDFVVSLQAVHELRHKRHALRLYSQLGPLLSQSGELLIADHLPEGAHTPRHRALYMNPQENIAAFNQAGFSNVEIVWSQHHVALYRVRLH